MADSESNVYDNVAYIQSTTDVRTQTAASTNDTSKSRRSRHLVVVGVLLALILAAVIGIYVLHFTQNSNVSVFIILLYKYTTRCVTVSQTGIKYQISI